VASARLLQAEGIQPQMVAGLSIGAFPAAVIAGVLDFHHAVQLVQLRGQLMEQAYPQGYGMCAITGLALPQLQGLLAEAQAAGQQVYLANINAEQQLVVAGADAGLQAIAQAACRRVPPAVSGWPSACPRIAACWNSRADTAQAMRDTPLHAPACHYLSANAARVLRQPEQIRDDLANNMARLVHWHDTARLAWERGARLAVEMLPGTTLSRLLKPVFAQGVVMTVAEDRLDSLQYTARRMEQDSQY
jgi:malonate decarboxylase epsilon subunit